MHNFLGFNMYFFIQGYRATNWNSKNLNIGVADLTRINFANINNVHKFIDTLKYYQQSLSQLTKSATKEEKEAIKKLAVQYIANHDYFGIVWEKFEVSKKFKILEIIAGGKGIIPYKNIISSDSLEIKPSGQFFDWTEFFSILKQQNVSNEDYKISFYLWNTLKMRDLSDMSDLYNTQDVILLCKIIENRFQLMQDKYDFNLRKCNSESTLSGSIERDLSKIIISLPTNHDHVELFEKTLTGDFSCVNTRLSFDTEILLPNVENPDKDNWKDYSYKVSYNLKFDEEEKYSTKRLISKINDKANVNRQH